MSIFIVGNLRCSRYHHFAVLALAHAHVHYVFPSFSRPPHWSSSSFKFILVQIHLYSDPSSFKCLNQIQPREIHPHSISSYHSIFKFQTPQLVIRCSRSPGPKIVFDDCSNLICLSSLLSVFKPELHRIGVRPALISASSATSFASSSHTKSHFGVHELQAQW